MTQNDRWEERCNAIIEYIQVNHRRPSKYKQEDMQMVNWLKYNKKLLHRGLLKEDRKEKLKLLLDLASKYQRVNQYIFVCSTTDDANGELTIPF